MKIRTIHQSEIDQWEQYVEEKPTIAWQTFYWSEIVNRHHAAEFMPVAAFEDDRICGIMPLYVVKDIRKKCNIISVPYAVGGGISADDIDIEKGLINHAIAMYKEKKADRLIFKQYKHKLTGPFNTDDNFYNRELDLTVGPENLLDNFDDLNKEIIKRSSTMDTRLEFPSKAVDRFYKLLLVHHRNNGVPCVSKKWISDLVDFKMYSIALLMEKERIVAGTMVKEHKKTVSFPFTAIPDSSERSEMFAYKLYWELIRKFSQEGKAIFHSGRIPNNNQTHSYRLGWQGKKCNYFYQYYPDTGGNTASKSKQSRKRQIVSSVWKKLPVGLTGIIGPKIVKYFP